MISRLFAIGLTVTLLSLLIVPGAIADAAEPTPAGFLGAFELSGTHGFRIRGLILSTGKAGLLSLAVGKEGEEVDYLVYGEVTTESAEFDLGALGRVEVVEQATGRTETVHPDCGKALAEEAWRYVGTIEFHGEENFTDAVATSTPVRLKAIADVTCPGLAVSETSGGTGPGVKLEATRRSGPSLLLVRNRPRDRVFYEAEIAEKEGAVKVERTVSGHLRSDALQVDGSLSTAAFIARAPFSGKGRYLGVHPPSITEARPGKGTWRGSLEVDFPGRAHTRLAGPGFKASIIHATRSETRY